MTIVAFGLLLIFQAKHFLADYPLQTPFMLQKFRADWGFLVPLLAHCSVHALFTFFILFCFAVQFPEYGLRFAIILLIAMADFAIHFFMDRVKAGPSYLGKYKSLSAFEFMALGSNPPRKITKRVSKLGIVETKTGWTNFDGTPDYEFTPVTREEAAKLKNSNTLFWWSLGLDQAVHHITDLTIVFFVLNFSKLNI